MIQGSVLQAQAGSAVDTPASTIPKGRSLDLTLVLLVQHTASVAGYPARGAGEREVVDAPM